MRKAILAAILSFMIIIPIHAKLSLVLSSDLSYNSNVFQLSPYDMDRYKDGEPTLSYIETADDLIWGTSLKLQYQYNWNNFKFRPYVKASANRFLSNVDKSNENILGSMTILHSLGELNLTGGYYPDNYLRKYKDKDGTGLYEKFTYDKNLYKADAYINVMKHESLYLYAKYEQYYYNKFFTEYDGNATTEGIGWRHSNSQFSFEGTYLFRKLVGESDTDVNVDQGDAAYESNIYSFGMTWKNWKPQIGSSNINIRPSVGITLEDRYYQGSDSFHSGRKDSIIDLSTGLSILVKKNLDISLDFSHTMRNVSSDILSVPRYKEYTEDTISAGFSYSINLMQ
jgi:hypothetical protein